MAGTATGVSRRAIATTPAEAMPAGSGGRIMTR